MSLTLTEKSIRILRKLFESSEGTTVFTVKKTQSEIAKELNITRQALNVHLRKLKKEGLIRTGRGFIDITKDALQVLGLGTSDAFVFLKVEPNKREEVYKKIKELPATKIYRVTGEIDLIVLVPQTHLSQFLEKVTTIDGIRSTSSHVIVSTLK
ncbi:MAG: AsnC family transcriptional regulator [Candidatus Methanomethylicota archaeon]|uniref:AsnC family transcriptional regulator n=1 Tax=Thermoproteota archaeon TaxID=2056631 RepID=A0A520KF20_9CREN|nr:MAG: winged helix-turn-helix transcriptional regulator [Candidatus Verstraetearchaeota archaeon]TDA38168.1 MAG: AsnC family transcriptional regulator [Candidatus Verstraetearchaeota archaeon]